MKKITLLIAFIGMITLQSCTVNEVQDNVDNDTIAEVFELRNVNFSYNSSTGGYFIYRSLNPQIYASDNILIYRMSDVIDSNTPVWQLIPRTLYFLIFETSKKLVKWEEIIQKILKHTTINCTKSKQKKKLKRMLAPKN